MVESERQPLAGLHVLIVEDEFIIGLDLKLRLNAAGADVIGPCPTVASARAAILAQTPSVAVLDLRLGRDTSLPIAEMLAERDIPFLLYSGQSVFSDVQERFPNCPIVLKPAPAAEIVKVVQDLGRGGAAGHGPAD